MFDIKRGVTRWLITAGVLSALAVPGVKAATVDITAQYRPSENNDRFSNTTPVSGFCAEFDCMDDVFSIALPITYTRTVTSGLPPLPERWSLKTPDEQTVRVTSDSGYSTDVKFRVDLVAQTLSGRPGNVPMENNPASHNAVGGGCTIEKLYGYGDGVNLGFAWSINNPVSPTMCYPARFRHPYPEQRSVALYAFGFSIGYTLDMPPPHTVPMGIYRGSVTLSVGEAGDFALGSNVTGLSTSSVTFNFTLDVHHQLQVQFPANSDKVVLEPAKSWQQWLSTGVEPEQLSARLPFRLTTSGPFSVRMQCGEDDPDVNYCVLRNQRTQERSAFMVELRPPKGAQYADTPGAQAPPRQLRQGQSEALLTRELLSNGLGTFVFTTNRAQTAQLIKGAGDEWAGLVTLVFDATL
jgi:hypothetical protein